MSIQSETLKQIDVVLTKYRDLRSRSKYDDCSDQPATEVTALITLMCDTVSRFAPPGSQYIESMKAILKTSGVENAYCVPHVAGVLQALRAAYESGYLTKIEGLLSASIFNDFREMAEYLLSEGYKDPAAVIMGSVLEEHLRRLCVKNGVGITVGGIAKKAEQMNTDLAGNSVYSKLDQKSVTAWLDLRNKAAHGKYTEYSQNQVMLMCNSVQDFITRIPS